MRQRYKGQCKERRGEIWQDISSSGNYRYSYLGDAIHELTQRGRKHPHYAYRVLDTDTNRVVWTLENGHSSTTQKENTKLHISKPLSVPRATLIEKIQASVDDAKAKYEAAQSAEASRIAEEITHATEILAARPDLVVRALKTQFGTSSFGATPDEFLAEQLNSDPAKEFAPDPQAAKLLSVLNAATDETLEVTAEDDLYKYL